MKRSLHELLYAKVYSVFGIITFHFMNTIQTRSWQQGRTEQCPPTYGQEAAWLYGSTLSRLKAVMCGLSPYAGVKKERVVEAVRRDPVNSSRFMHVVKQLGKHPQQLSIEVKVRWAGVDRSAFFSFVFVFVFVLFFILFCFVFVVVGFLFFVFFVCVCVCFCFCFFGGVGWGGGSLFVSASLCRSVYTCVTRSVCRSVYTCVSPSVCRSVYTCVSLSVCL